MRAFVAAALAACCLSSPALAQDEAAPLSDLEWMKWVPEAATISMPDLMFEETDNTVKNYHKYYYFTRSDTSFEEALDDLRDCDGHARGLWRGSYYPSNAQSTSNMMQYGAVAGAAGGLIAGAMMDAIVGSGIERAKRRINMRRCMFYKDYQRHGIAKEQWQTFNFEEGLNDVDESDRQNMLAIQARVASSPNSAIKELGL